jgi:hypothetical protein
MVYLQGFFQVRDLSITGKMIRLMYLPYWVGFFVKGNQLNLEIVDATRGRFEGAKVRNLVQDWFAREAQARRERAST